MVFFLGIFLSLTGVIMEKRQKIEFRKPLKLFMRLKIRPVIILKKRSTDFFLYGSFDANNFS